MPEVSFNRLAVRMSRHIDKITFGRLEALIEAPDWLKFACCEMCDVQLGHENAKTDGKNVKSVSNDGYSVTFSEDSVTEAAHKAALEDVAGIYIPAAYLSFDTRGELKV